MEASFSAVQEAVTDAVSALGRMLGSRTSTSLASRTVPTEGTRQTRKGGQDGRIRAYVGLCPLRRAGITDVMQKDNGLA